MRKTISCLVLLVVMWLPCLAHPSQRLFCKQSVFSAFRALPELTYECPEGLNDYDEKILKLSQRSAAIERLEAELGSFTSANWWQANVAELTACEIHGSAGELSSEEQRKLKVGDFWFRLFGNHQYRLILTPDPCYQTGYSGSNAFLLVREQGKVFITQVLNGYYSRIDNSVGMDSVKLNGRTIIEISTANNMPPEFTNYYFTIDPHSNRAIPRKIFKVGGRLTNNISSALIFNDPDSATQETVIRRNRLAPAFNVYVDDSSGKIDDGGRKLRKVIYRWNGRFYSPRN